MKIVRILFVVFVLVTTVLVKAQSTSPYSVDSNNSIETNTWQGLRFSYNSYTLDVSGFDAVSAYEIGYIRSFPASEKHPLFLETGANVFYATGDLLKGLSIDMYSLIVPLNIGYKVNLPNNLSFFPYFGVALKGHLAGELGVDGLGDYDMFDNTDFGEKCNRFQVGWQIGATLNVDKFNFGLSYGTDFVELDDDTDTKTLKISAGFNF